MNLVLTALTGDLVENPSEVIVQGYLGNSSGTANCAIKTTDVYSISTGLVISLGEDPKKKTKTLTVQADAQHWIRYSNLKDCVRHVGEHIDVESYIGTASGNLVRLEYCTAQESQFPVRELGVTLYKQDPTYLIFAPRIYDDAEY